ncbi:DUF5977 domain-containing protein [Gynurincola endophyticus]|uniref:DUF5977 domain-containing protein n=1 Tax=Gynurincola endophyticus TaxID=2479004 RepID=UPI000F8E548F|nr:DUF5977 domain-containing protein [Gynurincola endophyticus]
MNSYLPKLVSTFYLIFCFINTNVFSQVPIDNENSLPIKPIYNSVIPPSPDAASILQAAYGSVQKNTGGVSVDIPLYTVQAGSINLPVSLAYFSQGNKVDEGVSRVGYGWSLNASSVISRTIRGLPDESSNFVYNINVENSLSEFTVQNYDFFKNLSDDLPFADTQYDEYNFSVAGYSGKFVFDTLDKALMTENFDLKIEAQLGRQIIVITTPDGTSYHYGGSFQEKINSTSAQSGANRFRNAYSALFLFKISNNKGDEILLSYSSINTQSISAQTQTYIANPAIHTNIVPSHCGTCPSYGGGVATNHITTTYYTTYYITSIVSSNGDRVSFSYDPVGDASGEVKLRFVSISNYYSGILKSYGLDYTFRPAPANTHYKRYFLTTLTEKYGDFSGMVQNNLEDQVYHIEYYDLENSALPYTKSQDYAGFYNGKSNNNLLSYHEIYNPGYYTSDRRPSFSDAVKGVLKSIKYPNGQLEEYLYEGNVFSGYVAAPKVKSNYLHSSLYGYDPDYKIGPDFFLLISQNVTISLHTNPKYPESVTDSLSRVATFILYKNGSVVDSFQMTRKNNPNPVVITKSLEAGYYYYYAIRHRNDAETESYVQFQYDNDTSTTTNYVLQNEDKPGIRLKEIKYYDESNYVRSNFYKYSHVGNWPLTSGIAVPQADFITMFQQSLICDPAELDVVCTYFQLTSSTLNDYSIFGNSPVFYTAMTQSDAPNFENGGTEYTFYGPGHGNGGMAFHGNDVPMVLPSHQYAEINGRLSKVRTFDSAFNILTETEDVYESVPVPKPSVRNLVVTRNYEPLYFGPTNLQISFKAFNVIQYFYLTSSIRKTKTINKVYDTAGTQMVTVTEYDYNGYNNNSPSVARTIYNTNDTATLVTSYPTDFPSDPIYVQKVGFNEINEPVHLASYKNGQLLQESAYEYQAVSGKPSLILPSSAYFRASPNDTLQKQINYNKYSHNGNVLEVQKENDIPSAYIWGYNNQLPIAEVTNANYKNLFYTSFEDTGAVVNSYAGFKSSLNGINIQLTNLDPGTYVLSYWRYQSNSWNFVSGNVTVSGNTYLINLSGHIDEVRFYPVNALMKTYTYIPGVGVKDIIDANDKKVSYTYDQDRRVTLISDEKGNVLKRYCYTLNGQLEDCSGLTTYLNDSISKFFVRTNCDTGAIADSVLITVPTGLIRSYVSKEQANAYALHHLDSIGVIHANTMASCWWYNDEQSKNFLKSCPAGYIADSVLYVVPANTFRSAAGKETANYFAENEVRRNGQSYANANGVCKIICTPANCTGNHRRCVNNTCEMGVVVQIDCEFDPETNKYKYWFVYQFSDMSWSTPFYEIRPFMCAEEAQ